MYGNWIMDLHLPLLLKKVFFVNFILVNGEDKTVVGGWDSIHVLEVMENGRSATYRLTSTVMLSMLTTNDHLGKFNLSGSMTRQVIMPH